MLVTAVTLWRGAPTAAALGILTLLAGCSSKQPATYPVRGKVVFADGAPLTTGGVVLTELVTRDGKAFNARGVVQGDGAFELTTFEDGDGAVVGRHRVLVRAKREAIDYRNEGAVAQPVIDRRFEAYETSGLEFTVQTELNDWTLIVGRPT